MSTMSWAVFEASEQSALHERSGLSYLEFLGVPSLRAGLYELPAGAEDPQAPHAEDEVYYVLQGRATLRVAGETRPVQPGSIIYVRAGVEHRFEGIAQALKLLVVFAPGRP